MVLEERRRGTGGSQLIAPHCMLSLVRPELPSRLVVNSCNYFPARAGLGSFLNISISWLHMMCSLRDIIGCKNIAEEPDKKFSDMRMVNRGIEVDRSLHVSQESKTPYSDATQASNQSWQDILISH